MKKRKSYIPKGDLLAISRNIDSIKPNPKNPRINDMAVQGVIDSIKLYGFRDPIEVDEKGMIVAGHTRYKAAKKLGMKMVPVIMSAFDSNGKAFGYTVINNKTGEYAQWDNDQLVLIKDEFGFTPEELGFTEKEFIGMQPPSEKEMDSIPEKPKVITSKIGKIYLLGKHKLYCMDVLSGLQKLKDESINMVVTSPPYYGLRDYGLPEIIFGGDKNCKHSWESEKNKINFTGGTGDKSFWINKRMKSKMFKATTGETCIKCKAWKGQLGLEPTPEMCIDHLVKIFSEVKRVLKKDGTCWINIGDTYAQGQMTGRVDKNSLLTNKSTSHTKLPVRIASDFGLKHKDKIGIPHMLAFAMRQAGWYWRDEIIWSKPNCLTESVKDRCTKSHEFIFMFTKSGKYYYDQELIKEKAKDSSVLRYKKDILLKNKRGGNLRRLIASGVNKRSVWSINKVNFSEAHFAVFPSKLIEPCILAGCPKDGIVLDPFMGAGTTMIVAEAHNRKSIGFELSMEYCDMIRKRYKDYTNDKNI